MLYYTRPARRVAREAVRGREPGFFMAIIHVRGSLSFEQPKFQQLTNKVVIVCLKHVVICLFQELSIYLSIYLSI